MAAIKHKTLAALTGAAMSIPGIQVKAAIPVAEPEVNMQYGYYREQGDRMRAEVFHSDFVIPFAERVEFTFNADFDTYVGATPLYSMPLIRPDTMDAAGAFSAQQMSEKLVDVVAAASAEFEAAWHMASPLLFSSESTAIESEITTDIVAREGLNYFVNFPFDTNVKPEFKKEAKVKTIERFVNFSLPSSNKITQKLAVQPRESRNMPILGANVYLGPATLAFSGGFSNEPDFKSAFGTTNLSWEFNKSTTLSAGYSLTGNKITRSGGHGSGHHSGFTEVLDEKSTFNKFYGGLTQVLSKNTLFQFNAGYTAQRGYLSNPYKFVYIRGEVTPEEYYDLLVDTPLLDGDWAKYTDLEVVGVDIFREVRPRDRDQWFFATQLNQHIPALDASLHFNYRYYKDSWKIRSHTFELSWYQSLPFGITLTPHARYYSQSRAEFFAPYFLAPRADGFYSSDYRLSGYGKLSSGLSFSKQFTKGVRLDAGFEYYIHKASLKLGGDEAGDYADITSYLLNASINVNLSSLGRSMGRHNHQHMQHHGAHPPAGVMAGHMLDKAGDMMLGYQYMYVDRAGDTVNGMHEVSDAAILNHACTGKLCSSKAKDMRMHMHMFNFMYAPTDWLNLMLMPQIISMEMDMMALPGGDPDEAHEGAHASEGLGDTLMMAMFKLFKSPDHNIHLGLGVSAPTGNTDATLSGLEDTDLQGYGMQVGSGTWDFKPSVTYTGKANDWSWGGQVNATKRLQHRNNDGYVLGDNIQGSIWGGYSFLPWLSGSVRGVYTAEEAIKGQYSGSSLLSAPTDLPENYGGQFWDLGLGLNISIPKGDLAGNSFSVEWLQPIKHDYNGHQLERDGSLSVRWGYSF